ncbi:hypothetical protein [Sphingopyxis sp.]|jgi:hypothetical protein|uniref:hypothetical protein n=1 Tax=Sphingopyxis sp. TaxID=1908224 RepID=UPI003F71F9BE
MRRIVLTLALIPFGVLTPVLELGVTHVVNPDWPGHARLHEVWQLLTNSSLAMLCLWLIWCSRQVRLPALVAFIISLAFLVAYALSPLYGGTMLHSDGSEIAVGGVNLAVAMMLVTTIAIGAVLASTFRAAPD